MTHSAEDCARVVFPGWAATVAATTTASPRQAVTRMSPVLKGSSCGSAPVDEMEANTVHPVDQITGPTPCKLYVPQQWVDVKVALGQAWPVEEGMQLHGCQIPAGYAKVSIDTILKKRYHKILLDYPPEEDRPTLGENRSGFVPWRKRYIKFDDQGSSSDDDSHTSPPQQPQAPSPSRRDPSPARSPTPPPPARERTPSPPRPARQPTPPPPPRPSKATTRKSGTSKAGSRPESADPEAPGTEKDMDASITSHMKRKEQDEPISEDAIRGLLRSLKQSISDPLPSDYKRQIKKGTINKRAKQRLK